MITFVLPAYNEDANLPALLERIAATMKGAGRPWRVVAVNDGSRDGTAEVLRRYGERLPVEVVTHPVNLGLARTIVDGLRYATETGADGDVVISMDADNSHEPSLAPAMIARVEEGHDVVVASRYRPGAQEIGLSFRRRFLSLGVNLLLRMLLPLRGIRDYSCGYRAYRRELLQKVFTRYGERVAEATTFAAMAEILLKAGNVDARAAEVPLVLRYDQKRGASKMRVLDTILDYFRLMGRLGPGWRGGRGYLVVLLAVAVLLFFFRVGMPLTDGDTAYYGKIARNILERGDWVTLHYRGDDFVDKPPLSIWPMAVSYLLFGFHDWATRAWHSLLAVGSVLLTYGLGRRLYSAVEGFWGGLVLATSFLLAYSGQVPQQDVPLLFFSLLCFWALVRYVQEGRAWAWLLAGAAVGLAVLTRGLQGAVFPAGVALVYLGLRWLLPGSAGGGPPGGEGGGGGLRIPSLPLFVAGVGAFLLVTAPWYCLEFQRLGWPFLRYYFGAGNTRYLTAIAPPSPGGPLAYLPLLVVAFLPWAGLAFSALRLGVREALRRRGEPAGRAALFLLSWFLVAFFLPFAIRWRVIRYLLPALPPLALLTGRFLRLLLGVPAGVGTEGDRDRRLTEYRWLSWGTLAAGLLLVAGVLATVPRFREAQEGLVPVLLPFLAVFLGALALSALLGLARRVRASVSLLAGGALLAYLVVFAQLDRHIYLLNPWPPAARAVNTAARPSDRVVFLSPQTNPFVDYYVLAPVEVVPPERFPQFAGEGDAGATGGGRRLLVLADEGTFSGVWAGLSPEARAGWSVRRWPGAKVVATR